MAELVPRIQKAMKVLTPRQSEVLNLYFGLDGNEPLDLEEIGERFELTRERVRQIKEKSLKRLGRGDNGRKLLKLTVS